MRGRQGRPLPSFGSQVAVPPAGTSCWLEGAWPAFALRGSTHPRAVGSPSTTTTAMSATDMRVGGRCGALIANELGDGHQRQGLRTQRARCRARSRCPGLGDKLAAAPWEGLRR